MRQPLGIGDFHGLGIEDIDEAGADNLTFGFGIFHSGQFGEEFFARIHTDHVQSETFVVLHHRVKLVFAEQTVVDENTSEAISDGFVEQNGCHRRIDTARETEDDAIVAQLLTQLSHRAVHERSRAPVLTASADVHDKVAQQLRTLQRVEHFRVELYAPQRFAFCLIGGKLHFGSRCNATEMVGDGRNRVAVTHPNL